MAYGQGPQAIAHDISLHCSGTEAQLACDKLSLLKLENL